MSAYAAIFLLKVKLILWRLLEMPVLICFR